MPKFIITNDEYELLDKKYGKLCCKAAWELMRKNVNRTSYYDVQDIIAENKWYMVSAGMYFKRQTYIEESIRLLRKYCSDKFDRLILIQLSKLWDSRKYHGASKKKFGDYQEYMLEKLVIAYIPKDKLPDINSSLIMNNTFSIYVKSIIWNRSKFIGKQFTKDNHIRSGSVSLSEKDFYI